MGRFLISSQRSLTEPEIAALKARQVHLDGCMAGASLDAVISIVGPLLNAFPASARSEGDWRDTLKLYGAALREVPTWAVEDAALRYLDGRVGDRRFAPTPAQLAAEAREIIKSVTEERRKISTVLSAQVYHEPTPEERGRVSAGLESLLSEIAATTGADPKGGNLGPVQPPDAEVTKAEFEQAVMRSRIFPRDTEKPNKSQAA